MKVLVHHHTIEVAVEDTEAEEEGHKVEITEEWIANMKAGNFDELILDGKTISICPFRKSF